MCVCREKTEVRILPVISDEATSTKASGATARLRVVANPVIVDHDNAPSQEEGTCNTCSVSLPFHHLAVKQTEARPDRPSCIEPVFSHLVPPNNVTTTDVPCFHSGACASGGGDGDAPVVSCHNYCRGGCSFEQQQGGRDVDNASTDTDDDDDESMCEEMADSFSELTLSTESRTRNVASNSPAPLQSPSHSSSGGGNPTHQIQRQIQYPPQLCLNCRAEANLSQGIPHNQPPQSLLLLGMPSTASAIGGDDTTVDELAGYFDLMLYLPRPMSEMAELMYT